jgi:hypothetical protein
MQTNQTNESSAEQTRLQEDREGRAPWKKWGRGGSAANRTANRGKKGGPLRAYPAPTMRTLNVEPRCTRSIVG